MFRLKARYNAWALGLTFTVSIISAAHNADAGGLVGVALARSNPSGTIIVPLRLKALPVHLPPRIVRPRIITVGAQGDRSDYVAMISGRREEHLVFDPASNGQTWDVAIVRGATTSLALFP
jgi:hypothetical protein